MLAGGDRLFENGNPLLGRRGSKKIAKSGSDNAVEIGRPLRELAGTRNGGEPLAVAPISSSRGSSRAPPRGRPPSSMIGTKALARCCVEPIRPVAPLTMIPIVWVAIVQMRPLGKARQPVAGLCYADCRDVHVSEADIAPPYRLPHLRLRHPIRIYRPRHDHADAAVAGRVRPHRGAPNPGAAQGARHPLDLVHSGLHHREPSARLRSRGGAGPRGGAPQLGACAARAAEPGRGGSRSGAGQRGDCTPERPQRARLSFAGLGPEREHHRASARPRLPVRFRA